MRSPFGGRISLSKVNGNPGNLLKVGINTACGK
jgi:hypothetical protein